MDSEKLARFERELAAMARHADDAEGLEQFWTLIKSAREKYSQRGAELVAEGFSSRELARAAGISAWGMAKRLAPTSTIVSPS